MYEGRQRGSRLLFTDSFFSMAGMIFPMVAAILLARSQAFGVFRNPGNKAQLAEDVAQRRDGQEQHAK